MPDRTPNKDELFDGLLLGMAQRHVGGIDDFLDTVFSFLSRKTDLFSKPEAAKATLTQCIDASITDFHARTAQEQLARDEQRARVPQKQEEPTSRVEVLSDDEETPEIPVQSPADDPDKPFPPNAGNGYDYGRYSFTQTLQELEVRVPLPRAYRSKELFVEITSDEITVKARAGDTVFLAGPLFLKVKPSECMWTLDNGTAVCLQLTKQNNQEWWKSAIQGDHPIDLQKVSPENSKLDDLDGETRKTVEKMMYDQRQKQRGLPTSDDEKKNEMLQKFMAAHPEMDFSNAKIS